MIGALASAPGGVSWAQVAVGIITVFAGGGSVQLMIFLLKRRAVLRDLSANTLATERTSAEPLLKGYGEYVERLVRDAERRDKDIENLQNRLDEQQLEIANERKDFRRALQAANSENERLATKIGQLETDAVIQKRQIEALQRQTGT